MSTHSHEIITDARGQYPEFLQTFHHYLGFCTKAYRSWPEEVFNKDSSGAHALLTSEATLEAIAYLIANPVEAGAVRYAKDWPGAHTLPGIHLAGSTHRTHTQTPRFQVWARARWSRKRGQQAQLRFSRHADLARQREPKATPGANAPPRQSEANAAEGGLRGGGGWVG